MVYLYELASLDATEKKRLLRRKSEQQIDELIDYVKPIIKDVRERGDEAIVELTAKFDKVQLKPEQFRVTKEEIAEAYQLLDPQVTKAIKYAIGNVKAFHQKQMPHEQWFTEVSPGVTVGEQVTPISAVALYVPRGKGSFPSVMYMLAVPAVIAGVPRIVVCTPPTPEGKVDAASLVAADLCGITEIYRLGGVVAMAALAYGTTSVPRVPKIIGPGNSYVTAAKRVLYGTVNVACPQVPVSR